jgi:hydrogenase 3 maturation protease
MVKYLILCIGNPQGGDDSVGPYIAEKLKKHQSDNLIVINAETVPENYTGMVKQEKPDVLIIVDAIEMGINPGETRIVKSEKIGEMHISTHGIPISVLVKYLKTFVKKIILIGIQPSSMSGEISEKVKNSAKKLIDLIKEEKINTIKKLK